MSRFGHFLAIDWSGAVGEFQRGIAVARADSGGAAPVLEWPQGGWSRGRVLDMLAGALPADTLVGLDLGISLPLVDCGAYFPGRAQPPGDAHELWALIEETCTAEPHLGAAAFADHADFAPYFRRHKGREGARFRCDDAAHGRGRLRVTERVQQQMGCRPCSNFNLVGPAQVGKASLTGMRVLHRLAGKLPVWPVDPLPRAGSVVVEIYTGLCALAAQRPPGRSKMRSFAELNAALDALASPPVAGDGPLDEHSADALLAAAWLRIAAGREELWSPRGLTTEVARTEGWTFGAA